MPLGFTDDQSTLVQVMAWCQATSHYLRQCWPRSMSPHGVTRPEWAKPDFSSTIKHNCLTLYRSKRCIAALKFPWHFQGKRNLVQGTIWNIFEMFCLTPWTQESFSTFSWKSVSVSKITGKWVNIFSWNVQQRLHMRQGTICNIFGMLQLTHWIQDRFFYFLDVWLLVISCKMGKRVSWNFHEMSGTSKK